MTEVPADRWDADALYDPDPKAGGKIYARHGGFLQGPVDRFDASFFGISPNEAWPMDPSQRLLLEVAWECLEHAGIPPHSLMGTDAGVFIGLSSTDYMVEQARLGSNDDLSAYHGTGLAGSFGSGRLSHFLGVEGPCVSIDTACSSSMVATIMAAESLWAGRCRMALAGGCTLLLSPTSTMVLCRLAALSPSGKCSVFDAGADGYVRGEGAGLIALKTLRHALEDGDRVLALIRAGAWNHDGRSSSLTIPRPESQQRAMRAALERAGLHPHQIGYVEAHGTGTPVGDPIEATAIGNVLGLGRSGDTPLFLGSGKTNIGHLEIASGVAAIIKVVLSLQHREIPAHLNLAELNPHVDWERYSLRIPTETTPWDALEGRRIAGINSFGLSGTNAHMILEEGPPLPDRPDSPSHSVHVLTVSGRTEGAVRDLADRYRAALAREDTELRDFCYTSTAGRTHHRRRLSVVGRTREELIGALEARAAGQVPLARSTSRDRPKLAFLCTGQGAQYPGMGRGLFEASPDFRAMLEHCDEVLRPHLERPLLSVLYEQPESALIHQTEYTQPALFAVEMALASLWKSWGIEPSHVTGHSLGEYVAATLAGVFDLDDALVLVARRGRLMREFTETGSMAAVFASEERVLKALGPYLDTISIAAINGPEHSVISGRRDSVISVLAMLEATGVGYRELEVSHAFHSPLMDPILDRFEAAVRESDLGAPSIPLVSNLTGAEVDAAAVSESSYWRRHVRDPVRFSDSIRALRADGVECFLELGPHPTLLGIAGLTAGEDRVSWVPSLRKGRDDINQILEAVGALYEAGFDLDWTELSRGQCARRATIPTYPFQRKRHWHKVAQDTGGRTRVLPVRSGDQVDHPLLGTRLRSPSISGVVYQAVVESDHPRYLGGYRIDRLVYVSPAALLEAVQAGVENGLRWRDFGLADVRLHDPLALPKGDGRVCQVIFADPGGGSSEFSFLSAARSGSGTPRWTTHLTGTVTRISPEGESARADAPRRSLSEIRERCDRRIDIDDFYESLGAAGVRLGATFRAIQGIWASEDEVLARVELPEAVAHEESRYRIHPSLLHALIQIPAALAVGDGDDSDPLLACELGWLRLRDDAHTVGWIHATVESREGTTISLEVRGYDDEARELVEVRSLVEARTSLASLGRVIAEDEWSYGIEWQEVEVPEASLDVSGSWLVLQDASGIAGPVALELESRGASVYRCTPGPTATRPDDGMRVADLSDPNWAEQLIDEIHGQGGEPLDGIVSFLGLDVEPAALDGGGLLDRAVTGCSAVTDLVRALTRRGGLRGKLLLVTRGASDVGVASGAMQLATSCLWGLQPVLRSEHPEIRSLIVDLDPAPDSDACGAVLAELTSADSEDRVAYRLGKRWVPRLGRFRESGPTRESLFRSDRAYFVSGGLGGIGKAVAEWLVGHRVGMIALNARRAPDEAAMDWIEKLRQGGTRVEVLLGDVSERDDVDRIFQRLKGFDLELGGVFHAAGVLDDGLLVDMSSIRYRKVMASKVGGAWNLHLATRDWRPDHFVLFSSVSAFMGSPLQGNYAAANAFMGALATHRTREGLPALCVDWGPWAGAGMAARLADRERQAIERRGMEFLEAPRALGLLEHHLREPTARVAVMAADWRTLGRAMTGIEIPPLLSELVHAQTPEPSDAGAVQARVRELNELPGDVKAARLMGLVVGHLAQVLGVAPDQLAPDSDARESGLDSLMALELRHRVELELGVTLPATALMDGLSPTKVVAILGELMASTSTAGFGGVEGETEWLEGEI